MPTICALVAGLFIFFNGSSSLIFAQNTSIIPDATLPGGNNSIVLPNDSRMDIAGGHTVGSNLFHSFSDFQVGNGGAANFFSQGAENILSRVTGSNPSNLFGTVGVDIGQTNRSNANLFFLNPNGIVFGPSASLDLNGSFHVSTANSLRLGAGSGSGLFNASDPTGDLITSAPPSAFGFLGGNSGTIAINQSTLRVSPNQSLNVVGGAISITGDGLTNRSATVQSPGGTVGLISVTSAGEVPIELDATNLDAFATLGAIAITQGALVDTSGNAGGAVVIRGGQLLLDQTQIFSDTLGTVNGSPIGIDIQVEEAFTAQNGSTLTTDHLGPANSGDITIVAGAVTLTDSLISSRPFNGSTGSSGDVLLDSFEGISIADSAISTSAEGDFEARALGNGGNVSLLTDQSIQITNGTINTSTEGFGQSGNVTIGALQDITLAGSDIVTSSTDLAAFRAGDVGLIAGRTLTLNESNVTGLTSSLIDRGASISLIAPLIQIRGAEILTGILDGEQGGNIQLLGEELLIQENVLISNLTFGDAPGGDIIVEAQRSFLMEGSGNSISTGTSGSGEAGSISLSAPIISLNNEATVSSTLDENSSGNGSSISIRADQLNLFDGSNIRYLNQGSGNAGDIDIVARQSISLSGISSGPDPNNSAIVSFTTGGGNAGLIAIESSNITLDGGRITSSVVEIPGADGAPGQSGDVNLTVNSLSLTNDALITATAATTGNFPGAAGQVTIKATEQVSVQNSFISSLGGVNSSSGFITLSAPILTLSETSIISTLTENEPGGEVKIDVNELHLQSGARIDSSTRGAGQAGRVIVQARDLITISGRGINETIQAGDNTFQSAINSASTEEASGSSGEVSVSTLSLQMNDGLISTSAFGNGDAGNIVVASNEILLVDSTINSRVNGSGSEGSISLLADQTISITGGLVSIETTGAGAGGQISLIASSDVQLDRTNVSSKSTGIADAGNIDIQSSESIRLETTTVITSADQASGGNIKLTAPTLIQVLGSTIESSVQGDAQTQGGNIGIDPEFVVIQNSNILARANDGAGGNINIVGNVVFVDPLSSLDASAGPAGVDGSVNIQAPIQNLSGSIAPLPEGIVEVAALYNAQCAGQKGGEFSSFTLKGRDRLPLAPGELLPTPLFLSDVMAPPRPRQSQNLVPSMTARFQLPGIDWDETATFPIQMFNLQGSCRS